MRTSVSRNQLQCRKGQSGRRGGSGRLQPGMGGGAVTRQRGVQVRLVSNDGPLPTCPTRKRSSGFSSVGAWRSHIGHVIDITSEDPPSDGTGIGFNDFASTPVHLSQATPTQLEVRGMLTRKRNGNWSNEQLALAIAAFDNGMNMKKASEQFHIP